ALAVCVGGFFITRSVVREFRAYFDPGPHEVGTESCTLTDGRATLHATIHNLDDHVHDYRIEVTFTGNDGDSGDDTVTVDNVGPDATSQWTAGSELAGSSGTCKVTDGC